jgi:3-hydroxymyristoyl/3-hydroxydecanoyl-(acyl carrier protein) dehydratase
MPFPPDFDPAVNPSVRTATIAIQGARIPLCDLPSTLLQTSPFRFVDAVTDLDLEEACITGTVAMESSSDRFYSTALFAPLLIEAFAQMSSLLLARVLKTRGGGLIASIERAVFASPPGAGEISLAVNLETASAPHFTLKGIARHGGERICEAHFAVRSRTGNGHD